MRTIPNHVAIDLDDVVLQFAAGVCEVISRDFDTEVRPEDIVSWDFGVYIDHILGEPWWDWLRKHSWLWSAKFKPVPGAIGSLEVLRQERFYLELITRKPEWAESEVWAWLGRYLKVPTFQRVTILPTETGGWQKHEVTDALVLLDDNYEQAWNWADSKLRRTALLFTQPHNQEEDTSCLPNLIRVDNWKEAVTELRKTKVYF